MGTDKLFILSLFFFVYPCTCVIYKLNASEYARMPALFSLDEYEVCLSQDRGLYCMVKLNLFDDGENPLMNLIHEYSENKIKHYNYSYIEKGVCMQDACGNYINESSLTEEAITRALGACLNESIWQEYGLQANVSALYNCDRNGESDDISSLDWTVMAGFIIIIVINVVASYYDYALNHLKGKDHIVGNKYILSFSMIQNFQWLITFQSENPKIKVLQFIHSTRVITNILMILAHAMLMIGGGFTTNTHDFEKSYDLTFYQLVFNGLVIVQIFFFTSGFLLAYNFQIYAEKKEVTWFDIPKVMILRCCRLTPALAVVLAFTVTWLRHLGSGPLWKLYITNSVVAECRSYWWHHLLFVNNYIEEDKYCMFPTWYIASDTQVYLIGLVACVATIRRGRYLAMAILLLVGTVLPALQVWLQDLDGVVIMYPEFYRSLENPTLYKAHKAGHNNLQCFVAGMAIAYLVYDWQKKGVDLSKNKYYGLLFWLSPGALALSFYSGTVFYTDGPRASLLTRMIYAGAHRLTIAVIAAFFTVGMVLKTPSYFRSMAEWRMWVVPSRLTYSVYLLHMSVLHPLIAIRLQLTLVSCYNMIIIYSGVVFLTYIIAVPFFLMVEAPLNKLVKVLLDPLKPTDMDAVRKNKEEL